MISFASLQKFLSHKIILATEIIIMMNFPIQEAPTKTTSGAANDEILIKMMTFLF